MYFTSELRKKPLTNDHSLSSMEQLWLKVNSLSTTLTFLQTGAHPDDETSPALAYLARELGVRVVYCCAVRGEGGQNSIGTEKATALGVLRTREMEQAARNIPMELYWNNTELDGSIRDFGFSKSGEDTFTHWGEQKLLESLVRSIREVKPNVICPTFLDVEGQHGHHRAVTRATIEAYHLAADAEAFPEHLTQGLSPWQANQLLLPAWGGGGDCYDDETPPPSTSFEVPTDKWLPTWHSNCFQLGEQSRQYHQTQQMGFEFDSQFGMKTPFHVLHPQDKLILGAGMPLSVCEWSMQVGASPELQQLEKCFAKIKHAFPDREAIRSAASDAIACLGSIDRSINPYLAQHLEYKKQQLQRLVNSVSDLSVHASFASYTLYCSETELISVTIDNRQPLPMESMQLCLCDQFGAPVAEYDLGTLNPLEKKHIQKEFVVPTHSFYPYQPHFKPESGNNALYASLKYTMNDIEFCQPIELPAILIQPSVNISMQQSARYLNLALEQAFEAVVEVSHITSDKHQPIEVHLTAPHGWRVEPETIEVTQSNRETESVLFKVYAPQNVELGHYTLSANAVVGEQIWDSTFHRIDYPHIEPTGHLVKATQSIQVVNCETPKNKIGCLIGATDNYLPQLSSLGIKLHLIDTLDAARLAEFDTLFVGSCGFASVDDASALIPWVKGGGRLVSLYHRPHDNWNPPSHIEIGSPSMRWRVTQANSPLKPLLTESNLLNNPNVLDEQTWQGWHKERGLYFAKEWSNDYQVAIEVEDADSTRYYGGLLHGFIERGQHIHCALSLGHQLERVVGGAALLIANMLTYER